MTTMEEVRDKIVELAHDAEWQEKKALFDEVRNLKNWKLPTNPKVFTDEKEAEKLQEAIIFFTGGCEVRQLATNSWLVHSKGYYFFIGA
jgi:hypothetical protein